MHGNGSWWTKWILKLLVPLLLCLVFSLLYVLVRLSSLLETPEVSVLAGSFWRDVADSESAVPSAAESLASSHA